MFNFFTTIFNAIEHTTVKKTFGSYKNAAIVEGNLNLLHKLQDEKLCNSRFIEPEESMLTLDMLFEEPKPKPKVEEPEIKVKDSKQLLLDWFNSLTDEEKAMLKELNK